MTESTFVHVTYISSTPQRIWEAITQPEFARQYWFHENVSDWKAGSRWEHRDPNAGKVKLVGKVIEASPPRRLVLTWANPADANDERAHSRVTIELEPIDTMVRLTVTHDRLVPGSEMERGIQFGWPLVIASLKSFLETGKPLPIPSAKAAAVKV